MSEAEQLCTRCARCCRRLRPLGGGGEFGATSLQPDEEVRFGCRVLEQPCRFLGGDLRCSIYSSRPVACVSYRCPTLQQLEAGRLTLEQALAQLQRA